MKCRCSYTLDPGSCKQSGTQSNIINQLWTKLGRFYNLEKENWERFDLYLYNMQWQEELWWYKQVLNFPLDAL